MANTTNTIVDVVGAVKDYTDGNFVSYDSQRVLGAYNLVDQEGYRLGYIKMTGVTVTRNTDGSILINGTYTGSEANWIIIYLVGDEEKYNRKFFGKKIKLVGTPSNAPQGSWVGADMNNSTLVTDTGSGVVFTAPTFNGCFRLFIRIPAGTTFNNTLFKPMLTCDLNATYADYVQSAGTNKELEENKWDKSSQKVAGAYNLLQNTWTTAVISNVTVTKNTDGTLSTSGTSNAADDDEIAVAVLQAGTYKMTGCPTGGGSSAYRLKVVNKTSSNTVIGYDDGDGLTITLAADATVGVDLVFASGVSMASKTFKPMITPDLNASYSDYVPYCMGNRDLTGNIASIKAFFATSQPIIITNQSDSANYTLLPNVTYRANRWIATGPFVVVELGVHCVSPATGSWKLIYDNLPQPLSGVDGTWEFVYDDMRFLVQYHNLYFRYGTANKDYHVYLIFIRASGIV